MRINILSLGTLAPQNQGKTIEAFSAKLCEKSRHSREDMQMAITALLQSNETLIKDFKLGRISEDEFTKKLISDIQKATRVELSTAEFNSAWHAMNPEFSQYYEKLHRLTLKNQESSSRKYSLVSDTNPKDMAKFFKALSDNCVPFEMCDDGLVIINGTLPLYLSYAFGKTKAGLIELIMIQAHIRAAASSSPLATSMSNGIGFANPANLAVAYHCPSAHNSEDEELQMQIEALAMKYPHTLRIKSPKDPAVLADDDEPDSPTFS
jgi:hypothetical protein